MAAKASVAAASLSTDEERQLLQELKELRLSIAREQNLPPYVIFHDKTLIDMVLINPQNYDQLAMVNGVGQSKLQKYGDKFLRVIRDAN